MGIINELESRNNNSCKINQEKTFRRLFGQLKNYIYFDYSIAFLKNKQVSWWFSCFPGRFDRRSGCADSNRGPPRPKRGALPTALHPVTMYEYTVLLCIISKIRRKKCYNPNNYLNLLLQVFSIKQAVFLRITVNRTWTVRWRFYVEWYFNKSQQS